MRKILFLTPLHMNLDISCPWVFTTMLYSHGGYNQTVHIKSNIIRFPLKMVCLALWHIEFCDWKEQLSFKLLMLVNAVSTIYFIYFSKAIKDVYKRGNIHW